MTSAAYLDELGGVVVLALHGRALARLESRDLLPHHLPPKKVTGGLVLACFAGWVAGTPAADEARVASGVQKAEVAGDKRRTLRRSIMAFSRLASS